MLAKIPFDAPSLRYSRRVQRKEREVGFEKRISVEE